MTRINEYHNNAWDHTSHARSQEELRKIVKNVFDSGKIEKVENCYDEVMLFRVKMEFAPMRYIIKIDCGIIQEVIEFIEY